MVLKCAEEGQWICLTKISTFSGIERIENEAASQEQPFGMSFKEEKKIFKVNSRIQNSSTEPNRFKSNCILLKLHPRQQQLQQFPRLSCPTDCCDFCGCSAPSTHFKGVCFQPGKKVGLLSTIQVNSISRREIWTEQVQHNYCYLN